MHRIHSRPSISFARLRSLPIAAAALMACRESAAPPVDDAPRPTRVEIVSGEDQAGAAGAELTQPLAVRAADFAGRPVPRVLVTFRVTSGGGVVLADSVRTGADGVASTRWRLGTSASDPQRAEARLTSPSVGDWVTYIVTFEARIESR